MGYVKIRAFSLPTSLLLGVVQSALLGAKDSVTPLIAVWYSTIVNVVGDFLLVKVFGMGLRGASIATLLAQLGRCKRHNDLNVGRNSLLSFDSIVDECIVICINVENYVVSQTFFDGSVVRIFLYIYFLDNLIVSNHSLL